MFTFQFVDELIKDGEPGGQEASRLLMGHITEYVQNELPDLRHDLTVVVRVYANMKGLGKIYQDAKILDHAADLELFVRGFNVGHPMCDFIDAGSGKECSDEKIRGRCSSSYQTPRAYIMLVLEIFKLHVGDVHCKHILFGGSTDNGYARLLGPYSAIEQVCKRITMLEGPPFEKELAELRCKFRTTSFPSVFRTIKLPSPRRVSFSALSIKMPSPKPSSYACAASQSKVLPYHSAAATPTAGESGTPSPNGVTGQGGAANSVGIFRNKRGHRIDTMLKPSLSIVANLKSRKLCNPYHLLGHCWFANCKHEHGERLSEKEMEALRYVARLAPCPVGLECDDEECYSGHRCPNQPCHRPNCHFPKEMHAVDTKVAKTWFQNESIKLAG